MVFSCSTAVPLGFTTTMDVQCNCLTFPIPSQLHLIFWSSMCTRGSSRLEFSSSGVSMVFLVHPPLFCLGSPTRRVHLYRFSDSFARDFWFGHTCTGIFELFMVSSFISYLALMTMSQFSFLCLSTNALCTCQPGQFRFLHDILFDVACWIVDREQLMHMSHFSDSLTACLVLM